jgi:hypothetical protein
MVLNYHIQGPNLTTILSGVSDPVSESAHTGIYVTILTLYILVSLVL